MNSFWHAVPGVVSDLTGQPKFTSIVLTWSAPQEPNGVIISYEVTYRVSDGNLVTTNTTDLRFTIPSLTPGTNVTEISVSAYTRVGRGYPVQIPYLFTTTMPGRFIICFNCLYCVVLVNYIESVLILSLRIFSASSVNVTWERINTSLITSYIVYYRPNGNELDEKSLNVSSLQNSVIVSGLTTEVEYQFEVVAVAELDGEVVLGGRSEGTIKLVTPTSAPNQG